MGIIIDLDEERLLRSYDRIGDAIVNYIKDMDLCWEVEMARRIYFGKYIDEVSEYNPPMSYKPFIQWLIFSYKLHNGYSLIDCIHDGYMNISFNYEKEALLSLKNTHEGFYKVYGVHGNMILAKDIFTNENVYIWDDLLSRSVKRYSGIFTRIVSINNKNIPIPGYSVMTNSFLKDTHNYLIDKYKKYRKFNHSLSIRSFINSNSLMIHRYFLNYQI